MEGYSEAMRVRVEDVPPATDERHITVCPAVGCALMRLTRQQVETNEKEADEFKADMKKVVDAIFADIRSINNRMLTVTISLLSGVAIALLIYFLGKP